MTFIKILTSGPLKNTIKKKGGGWWEQATDWEKICARHIYDKEFVTRMKNLQFHIINNPIKMGKRFVHKRRTQEDTCQCTREVMTNIISPQGHEN